MIIREERKKKGLTQAQLGRLIGLKESRVSKIEHGAPISPEVASFILGKMGSALQINVVDKSGFNSEESDFVVSVINNFADEKKVPLTQAYSYIVTLRGWIFYANTKTLRRPSAIMRLSMMSHVYVPITVVVYDSLSRQ